MTSLKKVPIVEAATIAPFPTLKDTYPFLSLLLLFRSCIDIQLYVVAVKSKIKKVEQIIEILISIMSIPS